MWLPIDLTGVPVTGSPQHRQQQRDTAVKRARQRHWEERVPARPSLLVPVEPRPTTHRTAMEKRDV